MRELMRKASLSVVCRCYEKGVRTRGNGRGQWSKEKRVERLESGGEKTLLGPEQASVKEKASSKWG